MLKHFQTYFWKPLPSMGGWMGDHAYVCFILKIILNMSMCWEDRKYEIYTWYYLCFNWYHWILSIVSILTFLYTHILFLCMYAFIWYHLFWLVLIFHTPIHVLFVLTISLYCWAQILIMQSLNFLMTIMFQLTSFQLVS